MAKKRKSKPVRRRRMSGAKGSEGLQLLMGSVAGAIGSRFVGKLITTKMTIDAKILNGAFLAAGGMLALKAKNPFLRGAGVGIGSAAAIGLGQATGLLNGVGMGNSMYITRRPNQINGFSDFRNVPKVGNAPQKFFPTPTAVGGGVSYAGIYGG